MFLVAVGFWNFLGAGVFGFLVNLPIVSYYEIGTALTANHAHAAMMGVYGMLAMGLALFCLRYLIPTERWSDRLAKIGEDRAGREKPRCSVVWQDWNGLITGRFNLATKSGSTAR